MGAEPATGALPATGPMPPIEPVPAELDDPPEPALPPVPSPPTSYEPEQARLDPPRARATPTQLSVFICPIECDRPPPPFTHGAKCAPIHPASVNRGSG